MLTNYMIKWIGVSILVTMLFLSMGFQIVAINKSPKCDVKKSLVLNCTNLDYYCKSFLDTKGAFIEIINTVTACKLGC